MTWYAFQGYNNNKAIDIAGVQEKEATVFGFHGYATESQAEANPNSVNIFQAPFVNLIIADYHVAVSTQSQPGGKNASNVGIVGAISNAANGLGLPSFAGIDSFFGTLEQASTWLRILEVALGVVLIGVSLGKITGAGNIITKAIPRI
jgi:hypothetical protein